MPWNSTWPDGTVSVKANKTPGQQNTTYIETSMQRDHFWNEDANKDGHHDKVEMPKQETGGTPTDPSLSADMDMVFYAKEKTAADAVLQQDVQPFANMSTNVLQLLGMRACGLFYVAATVPSIRYAHNVASVARTAAGQYTVTFTSALPSVDYLVFGGAQLSNQLAPPALCGVRSNLSHGTSKAAGSVQLTIADLSSSGSAIDPLEFWFIAFGG